jgi:hypothetical protein
VRTALLALAFRSEPELKAALLAAARDDSQSLSGYVVHVLRSAVIRAGHLDSEGKAVVPGRKRGASNEPVRMSRSIRFGYGVFMAESREVASDQSQHFDRERLGQLRRQYDGGE